MKLCWTLVGFEVGTVQFENLMRFNPKTNMAGRRDGIPERR